MPGRPNIMPTALLPGKAGCRGTGPRRCHDEAPGTSGDNSARFGRIQFEVHLSVVFRSAPFSRLSLESLEAKGTAELLLGEKLL
jgi:hypothetical protein